MNINDKNTIKSFKSIKRKTKDFKEIDPIIIQEDSRNLNIFRIILGLTTNEFSKKIEVAYSWVYQLEHSRRKIQYETAKSYSLKIHKLFKEKDINKNIKLEDFIVNLNSLNKTTPKTGIAVNLDNLNAKDFDHFLVLINSLKKRTNNFCNFGFPLILEDSRLICVVRILLGLTQQEFAKQLKMSNMTVEELENGYRKIVWPTTAQIYAAKIQGVINKCSIPKNQYIIKQRWQRWKNIRKIKQGKHAKWKTIRKMTVDDFKRYFNYLENETYRFTKIKPRLIARNPQLISIFRILLDLTQRDLERNLSLKGRVISNYESSVYKTITLGNAEILTRFFEEAFQKQNLTNVMVEQAIEKFISVKESMYVHQNSFSRLLKSWTNQEKIIFRLLKTIKKEDLTIEPHSNIKTEKGTINVDFLVSYKKEPKVIIESTEFHHIKSKKFGYNFKRKVGEIDYRFTKIKKKFPSIKTFMIIKVDRNPILERRIQNFISNETISINKTFINPSKASLTSSILEVL
ncbi:helix-turn-helix transcriptional regulator [Candidatus Woesearchaeota archaeon]|nr:helix-turn-helix transcriptional regulator [Candidatus Woesearchaeota archaeon]